jgi:hypothetical protein
MRLAVVLCLLLVSVSTAADAGWRLRIAGLVGAKVAWGFGKACLKDSQCKAKGVEFAGKALVKLIDRYGADAIKSCIANAACQSMIAKAVAAGSGEIAELAAAAKGTDLPPPGNCEDNEYGGLNAEVDKACRSVNRLTGKPGPARCVKEDDLNSLQTKLSDAETCWMARMKRENYCFAGGDPGHKEAIGNLVKLMATCEKFIMSASR